MEIIAAFEGPVALTECSTDVTGLCNIEHGCPIKTNQRIINDAVRGLLDRAIETDKLRSALETAAIDSIKGHVAMRACDHQAMQQGYIVKVVKQEDSMPVPQVIATYPPERTAPACNKMTYDD